MAHQINRSNENLDERRPATLLRGTTSRRALLRKSLISTTAVASASLLVAQSAGATTRTALHFQVSWQVVHLMKVSNDAPTTHKVSGC
jgi:hypothetical protein